MAFIMAVSEVSPKIPAVTLSSKMCAVGIEAAGSTRAAAFRCPTASVFVLPMKDETAGKMWGFAMWKSATSR